MTEFDYQPMTPALSAYLAEYDGTPKDATWVSRCNALKAWLADGELDRYVKALREWYCRDESAVGVPVESVSPSGRYRLVVTEHFTVRHAWHYSKGRVYDGERLVAEVCRDFHPFPHAWVEGHPSGDFMVCAAHYEGQTLVDLTAGEVNSVHTGFCWIVASPSPDRLTIAVDGCYWGGTGEVHFLDFAEPRNMPWPVLFRHEGDEFKGWEPDGTCVIGVEHSIVDLPGHPLHGKSNMYDLSLDDMDEVDAEVARRGLGGDDPGFVTRLDKKTWKREGGSCATLPA